MLPHLTQELEYPPRPVNARALAVELAQVAGADARADALGNAQAGVYLLADEEAIKVWVRDEVAEPAVAAAVAAHDAPAATAADAALVALHATQVANERTLHEQLVAGLVTLDGHLTTLAGAATAAQQKAALVFTLKATKQLARLVLRKLDATD